MIRYLAIIGGLVCAALTPAPAIAADDFGPRFQNVEPAAMSDFPASRLNDISPAAGSEDGEMNNYVRGLFGSDMKGTKSIKRAYPETGKAQPIVRIYADPL